jgi:hypothetical protein
MGGTSGDVHMVAGNIHCPSCSFPVQVEWRVCRRCGTRLSLELRESSVPARASALGVRRAVPAVPVPRATSQPPIRSRAPGDTLLPHSDKPGGPDTLLPSEPGTAAWTDAPKRVAAGTLVAINVVLDRLRRRK